MTPRMIIAQTIAVVVISSPKNNAAQPRAVSGRSRLIQKMTIAKKTALIVRINAPSIRGVPAKCLKPLALRASAVRMPIPGRQKVLCRNTALGLRFGLQECPAVPVL